MLDEKIRIARKKLDESIITGKDYMEIYKLSVELDELIAEYYLKGMKNNGNTREKEKSNGNKKIR